MDNGYVFDIPVRLSIHDYILSSVLLSFPGIKEEDIKGHSRKRRYTIPRFFCMYFLYETGRYSLSEIGEMFSYRDHTSVMNARDKIRDYISTYSEYLKIHNEIKERLN